jgi:hypothetical protein
MSAKRKYPWEEWFGQPRTVLVRGIDYHCGQGIMWQQIRNSAVRYGVRVRLHDENDRIVIEVISAISHPDKAPIAG